MHNDMTLTKTARGIIRCMNRSIRSKRSIGLSGKGGNSPCKGHCPPIQAVRLCNPFFASRSSFLRCLRFMPFAAARLFSVSFCSGESMLYTSSRDLPDKMACTIFHISYVCNVHTKISLLPETSSAPHTH